MRGLGISSMNSTAASSSIIPHSSSGTSRSRAVWAGRILFVVALCAVAAVLGYTTHFFLTGAEEDLAESQFDSIADRALAAALDTTLRKRLGTVLMASIVAAAAPDADAWPFVAVHEYEEISTNAIATSLGREMGFAPLVTPDQLEAFETYAYDYFEKNRLPPFPNGTALSSFGKGVWGVNPALNTSDNRYHETDGSTSYGSPNKIFAPILQHNAGPHKALMINLHFQETRGRVIDFLIECAEERAKVLSGNTTAKIECVSVTDMLILTSQEVEPGPGALIMQPIYPAHNKTKLVGLIASSIVFDEVLEGIFADSVNGIDCVLESETQVYTYHVVGGIALIKGEGDLHDRKFDGYRHSIPLVDAGAGLFFSEGSASYTLTLYPSDNFFVIYSTGNPLTATIGAVCIILFMSLLFFMYDFCVRKEFSAKKDLLEAKRKFVRFVSHEVRTPLNSVCMGLTLLREEIDSGVRAEGPPVVSKLDGCVDLEATLDSVQSAPKLLGSTGTVTTQDSIANSDDSRSRTLTCRTSGTWITKDLALEWSELAEEVLTNAQSAVDVLNDLLNYDKVEMGTLSLEFSVVPIWSLIEKTFMEFKLSAAKKSIIYDVDFSQLTDKTNDTLPSHVRNRKAVGDASRICQVLRNLISNAIKFTPERGDITFSATWKPNPVNFDCSTRRNFTLYNGERVSLEPSGTVEVSVKDSGAGMTEAQVDRLFRQGVQFNANELQAGQGSGLGLFIAKAIAEQHGGTLTVNSEGLGKGSTFTLSLPLYHSPDPEAAVGESTFANTRSSICSSPRKGEGLSPLRLLVVDDSVTNRKLMVRLMKNRGHHCEEAEDGSVALKMITEKAEDDRYDCIILDYEMPVMTGPEACQELRRQGCDSFVVGVTGNVLPEDVDFFKSCGANVVLPKPFNFALLEEVWIEHGVVEGRGSVGSELPR